MTVNYTPEYLPKLIEQTEIALQKIEDMNKQNKNKTVHFFQASSYQQIKLAQQQLIKMHAHLNKLVELQDQYFTAALSTQAVAMDGKQPISFDEMQSIKGRIQANLVMIEKLISQKSTDELQSLRFLANQLTAQRKSLVQINQVVEKFVNHHGNISINNEQRLANLQNRVQKLDELLPKSCVQQTVVKTALN